MRYLEILLKYSKNLPFKGRSFRIPIVIPGTGLWLAENEGIGLHGTRALAFRFREVSRFETPENGSLKKGNPICSELTAQGCGRV